MINQYQALNKSSYSLLFQMLHANHVMLCGEYEGSSIEVPVSEGTVYLCESDGLYWLQFEPTLEWDFKELAI